MDWYYIIDEKKVGPVGTETLKSLVDSGKIQPKTPVWNKTMADWKPFGKTVDPFVSQESRGTTIASRTASCVECGRLFPEEEMVKYDKSFVCEACKPTFVQKIKEGINVGKFKYGGFWIRFGAKFIDGIILGVVNMIILFTLGALLTTSGPEKGMSGVYLGLLLQLLFPVIYTTWFLGKFAATPGKMACGLKVITADNDRVSYLRALGRHFSEFLSGIIFALGYLMAAWDGEKRALHDRICNTRVIVA